MERFWSKVDIDTEDACWLWLGATSTNGYGRFRYESRTAGAHRVAWELTNGPIPDGLVIDHLCRRRNCVNPAHMEVVTQGENVRRGDLPAQKKREAAARTHCRNGHAWADNAVQYATRRRCRSCHNSSARASYHRSKAAQ